MIRHWLLIAAGTLAVAGAGAGQSPEQAARAAIDVFAQTLQGELQQAMQSGGPQAAIEVCHTRAPEIATSVSRDHGLTLRRTSLKTRNPDNQPEPWQREVLESFQARQSDGEAVAELEYYEPGQGARKPMRFMKAIPTQPLCLSCHGTSVSDAVEQKLEALYPDDMARGYSVGDIRGAFVVVDDD